MKNSFIIILFVLSLLPLSAAAQYAPIDINQNIFYYSSTCPHCERVDEFFKQNDVVSKYNIVSKEISQNPVNAKELYDLMSSRSISAADMGVPYLNFEGQGYAGDIDIINLFKSKLGLAIDANSIPTSTQGQPLSKTNNRLTIGAVMIAALADSINPCAFSVMIFLLLSLLAIGAKKRMIKVGIVYIVTVYIVYLAAGLGLLAAMQWLSPISRYILYVAAALAIFAGLINIKDFFWYGKGFTLAIPESKKPIMEKYIKHASLPAAVILGFLVALFELPCTGGFYLAILALLARQTTYWHGVGYLIFYNLIFVAPLFVILAVVYKGVKPEALEKWRVQKRAWMRLLMGIVLIALGLSLIFLF
jgi:cytochrome c biogenesis protein CcdA/glutaredoxin